MRRRRRVRWHPEPKRPTGASAPPDVAAVVVGVAQDDRSDPALEWAAAEAAARTVPLRIVHAYWIPPLGDPWGALSVPPQSQSAAHAARQVLDNATVHALAVAPDLEVRSLAYRGSVGDGMQAEGAEGVVLVLGSGARGRTWLRPGRTTLANVAGRAQTPVVVVSLAGHPSAGPSRGRVVVGVGDDDGFGSCGNALAYAFDAAHRRRTGVTVVRAWTPVSIDEMWVEHALSERTQHESLSRAVAPYRDAFPDVDVRERVLPTPVSAALVDESDGATLLVVGSHQRRGLARLRSGRVRRLVLETARAPVVVVPNAVLPAPRSWWWRLAVTRAPRVASDDPVSPHPVWRQR